MEVIGIIFGIFGVCLIAFAIYLAIEGYRCNNDGGCLFGQIAFILGLIFLAGSYFSLL